MSEPQVRDRESGFFSTIYNFQESLDWFSDPTHQFWLPRSKRTDQATKHLAKKILDDPDIDTQQLIKLLQNFS